MRVAVHTPDVVGERMAGPGIRASHLAEELGKHFPTTLVARREDGTRDDDAALHDADVLIGQPARGFRRMRRGQRIVYDLFDPVILELREMYGRKPLLCRNDRNFRRDGVEQPRADRVRGLRRRAVEHDSDFAPAQP